MSLPHRIADAIRYRIASGELTPGYKLGQQDLAAMFNSSRVPVREALTLLTAEGALEHRPNRGFYVAAPRRMEIIDGEGKGFFVTRHGDMWRLPPGVICVEASHD